MLFINIVIYDVMGNLVDVEEIIVIYYSVIYWGIIPGRRT